MDFGNKIRRMAEKKQWEKLRGCFDGCEEERRTAAEVCGSSADREAYDIIVSQINSCADQKRKAQLIDALGETRRIEAAIYLSWLDSVTPDGPVKTAIQGTKQSIRNRLR